MKVILRKLWTEPAYFVAVLVGAGELVLQTVKLPDAVELPVSVAIVLLGGHVVRGRVSPVKRATSRHGRHRRP